MLVYWLVIITVLSLAGCTGEQDKTVDDLSIAYVKRPIPIVPNSNPPQPVDPDVRNPAAFNSGGDVYVRDSASPSAPERNITSCLTRADTVTNPNDVDGDVKDLEASYDGTKLIFSLFAPHDPNDNTDTTTWDIYEYDSAVGGCPRRIISDPIEAEKGDDLGPAYLPDGSIVFTSNRQDLVGAIQLDEGNVQFPPQDENQNQDSLVLHVMSASGTNIRQISFNQSHDLDPSVLSSGEIVFSRWDNMGTRNAINLFKVRPDGTELKALYGVHQHNVGTGGSTVQFLSPRELDDGRILGMIKPFNGSAGGGAPVLISAAQYADNVQPIWPYQGAGLTGNGQVNAVDIGVTTDASISPAGRFRSVFPIRDNSNRALVSWTQCRLQPVDGMGLPLPVQPIPCPSTIPAGAVEAFPVYGIYVYDLGSNTQLPVVIPQEGYIFDEPVVFAPQPEPDILFDKVAGFGLDSTLSTEKVGLLHIRSVYDFDGGFNNLGATGVADLATMANPTITDADARPARFLRIVKGSYIPDTDIHDFKDRNAAFGRSRIHGMREILGYVPIEPDGSVLARVPANIPLAISVVDKDGRRIRGRHQNWLQLRAGEVLECNGCHNHSPAAPAQPLPHGYSDAPTALNPGALVAGVYPGTNPALVAEIGDTMALTRIRTACGSNNQGALGIGSLSLATCPELSPVVDMRFTDVWADPAGTPIADLDLLYANLPPLTLPATLPATTACLTVAPVNGWNINCRTIINYEEHIHYLWAQPRAGGTRTCTLCHTNAGVVPDAQLDLTDGPSDQDPDHFKSYRELLFPDNEVDVNGLDVLVDQIVQDTDANGDPLFTIDPMTGLLVPVLITIQVPVLAQGPTMSIAGSRAGTFMGKFLPGATHAGDLTAEEIRLLSEWLDVGAQYYNNPFDAPVN